MLRLLVENLRTKVNVTNEEAKAALEASDWDMLDALVRLEGDGKVPEFTTKEKEETKTQYNTKAHKGLSGVWFWLKEMLRKGNNNQFVINRKGNELVAMPITVMALLMILVWRFSLILLFVGLFLGCRYSFRGQDINTSLNDMMGKTQEKAAVVVEAQVE